MITSPAQAEHIINTGQADAILMAREFLRMRLALARRTGLSAIGFMAGAISPRRAGRRARAFPVNLDQLKSASKNNTRSLIGVDEILKFGSRRS